MEESKPSTNDLEAQATRTSRASRPSIGKQGRSLSSLPSEAELNRIPTHLEWDSISDPENPHTWPFWKKAFHTAVPALYGFFLTIAASTYVPAIPYIQREFHVSRIISFLPLSMYTFGFTIGPIIAAPMSELYGRRIVYWVTLPWWMIFTSAAAVSPNITVLIIMRLLAGFGGSAALAIGAGTIADLWDMQAEGGKAALGFVIAPFVGSTLGPLVGAYVIAQYGGNWRWSMWVLMCIAAPVAIMAAFMSETSKSRILYLRQKKAGVRHEIQDSDAKIFLRKMGMAVVRPVHMMLSEPLVALLSIYTGFSFAMVFAFFGSFNYVFQSVYHFNQKAVGLAFIGIIVGYLFAVATFGIIDATLFQKAVAQARAKGEKTAPENRLYASMLGSMLLPIGLFWFAWAPQKSVHWIVPVLAGVPFGWGSLTVFLSATTYLVDVYGEKFGSSAIAANGILRFGFGAAFPLFTVQMYEGLGVHWAGSVFAFAAVLMMPVPWVFFKWGKHLRERSQYVIEGALSD